MLKLEDVDVDADDRPTFPQKIRRAEVIDNPFPDIEPRKSKDKEATDRLHEDRKRSKDKGKKYVSIFPIERIIWHKET